MATQNSDNNGFPTFKDFASYTTLHGLHFIFEGKSIIRRLFWLILVLTCLVLTLQAVWVSIDRYSEYDVITTVSLHHPDNLPFPAVSFCNVNMMKKSKILGTDAQTYLDQLDLFVNFINKGQPMKNLSDDFDLEQAVRTNGHTLDRLVSMCFFQGKRCNASHFTSFLSNIYGLCYTFNAGKNGRPVLKVNAAGQVHGLAIVLNVEPNEYYGPTSYMAMGMRFAVHDQSESPDLLSKGTDAMVGRMTNVRLKRSQGSSLPLPYKSACGTRKLVSTSTYSRSICLQECYSRVTTLTCGCKLLGMPSVGEFAAVNICTPMEAMDCGAAFDTREIRKSDGLASFVTTNQKDLNLLTVGNLLSLRPSMCDCPQACRNVDFDTALSSIKLLSASADEIYARIRNITSEKEKYLWSSKYQRESMAALNIFYEDLSTIVYKQKPDFDWNALAASTGGNLGLFLGCSVLTLYEFLDFFLLWLRKRWKREITPHCDQDGVERS